MDLAEEAFQLQREGQDSQAKRLFLEALSLEREAALLLPVSEAAEPSRSILFRSAASLAYNAEEYETAEQLIAHGLSGFPPPEIKEELKDLYENIEFKRYLPHHGLNEQIRDWYQQGLNYRNELHWTPGLSLTNEKCVNSYLILSAGSILWESTFYLVLYMKKGS
jgi:hypothetical protein